MISGFCLTTNALKNQYPVIESIMSFLPLVDELVVVDGGSTDGTREAIEKIGDSKIRIICDERTKWDDDWYYSQMGKNSNIGLEECKGDVVVKFDIDFVVHEDTWQGNPHKNFKKDTQWALENSKLTMHFTRRNFVLADRHFVKSKKTFAIIRANQKTHNIKIVYGLDLDRWKWGFEPIVPQFEENGIWFGSMVRTQQLSFEPYATIHNYDNTFSDLDTIVAKRLRHMKAVTRQQELTYKHIKQPEPFYKMKTLNEEVVLGAFKNMTLASFSSKPQVPMSIEQHPIYIREKIKHLSEDKLGHSAFGWLEKYGAIKGTYY